MKWARCRSSADPSSERTPLSSSSPRQSLADTARGCACYGNGNGATASKFAREPRSKYANSSNERAARIHCGARLRSVGGSTRPMPEAIGDTMTNLQNLTHVTEFVRACAQRTRKISLCQQAASRLGNSFSVDGITSRARCWGDRQLETPGWRAACGQIFRVNAANLV